MLQFYLWTKTPSNTEHRGEERSERGEGGKGKRIDEGKDDKENMRMIDKQAGERQNGRTTGAGG